MSTTPERNTRQLVTLAVVVTLKLLLFFLLGRTETMHFVYAGF